MTDNQAKTKTIEFKSLMLQVHEDLDKLIDGDKKRGVMSGLKGLDTILGGFMAPDLTILAARTGVGKTALMVGWICKSLWRGEDVLMFSCEMSAYQIAQRMMVHMSGIPGEIIRRGGMHLTKVEKNLAKDKLRNLAIKISNHTPPVGKLYIHDEGGIPIQKLAGITKEHQVQIVYVDYIQLVRPVTPTADRHVQVGEVSMGLKALAMDQDLPIVAAAQLNRQAAKNTPSLSDLRESGSLEQDADQVIFIERELTDGVPESAGEGRIMVMKNRHGATGSVAVWYDGSTFTFRDLEQ